ncbi:hypothetical protein ACJZ2D_011487 [Fusarium nematophilum]
MLRQLLGGLAAIALWQGTVEATPASGNSDINRFIAKQSDISIKGVLANIGSDGKRAKGAAPDSALTYKVLIERLIHGDKALQRKIEEYVSAQAVLQGVSNPSGSPDSGGLGEPKFHVNLTEFTGSWGRPQRDGPPLRATALTLYANWLVAHGDRARAIKKVWPVIEKDLAYTSFWVSGYIDSNINVRDGRTGKDANSILSSIHTFDPNAKCTDSTFQPCSARALANHKAVVDSFRTIYGVNKGRRQGQAAAVGRYSEDVYYDGNPWYLTTLAAAEQLYSAIYQWEKQGYVAVNQVSLPFFRDLLPNISTSTYSKNSRTFKAIIKAVHSYADGFVGVVRTYTPRDGSLAEQFDKTTGSPKSAVHLTWSYASFLGATERRAGIVSPSWGESRANAVPPVCERASACDSTMTFNVGNVDVSNENVFVVGSVTELANWSPEDGIPLKLSGSVWTAEIKIPSDTIFEYKYIKKTSDGKVTWESDPNRRATSSTKCGSSGVLDDEWR